MSTRCVVPPRWDEHTEPTWHRLDHACSTVKRNTPNTLTEKTWHRLCRACSRAPRLSTRYVVPPRWDEHTEPTWHGLDRACSRVKRNTHNTFTEKTWHRLCRVCSRAPRLSTRCVVPPRWDEHTEPTWQRWDRACSFFFNDTATTEIYTLSLHDALPIYWVVLARG